ncbi:MAG: SDR family NAD(P)-dependent oxidoreductase [Candidatus Latescibacterota bacterium]|nr:SDR family NAD(P)-dependent oxidoreductase [Candidatus Latescibacterota bacterium]
MNVLVTGASRGIGHTIAEVLLEEGHQLVLMARSGQDLSAIAERWNRYDLRAVAAPGDVADPVACARAVAASVESFGALHTVVNVAGAWVETPLIAASAEAIEQFVRTDVDGALQVTRAALPALKMAASNGEAARILHLNGLQGLIRTRPPVLYTVVESATRGLCESLRWEARDYGVHVGLITLGRVMNELDPDAFQEEMSSDGQREGLSRREVADAVLFAVTRPRGVNVDEIVLTPLGQAL